MNIQIKQIQNIVKNKRREKWLKDPLIKKFLLIDPIVSDPPPNKPAFVQYFEIYLNKILVGDIKVFGDKKDLKNQIAQILIVLGESRGKGIGTKAMGIVLDKIKGIHEAVYCHVNRYNIGSIKMLRNNGFRIKKFTGNEVVLYKRLRLKKLQKASISI